MDYSSPLRTFASIMLLACLVLVTGIANAEKPATSLTTTSQKQAPKIVDVKLSEGGTLRGIVVNGKGLAIADQKVILRQDGKTLATTTSNGQGAYAFSGLRGGVVQIVSEPASGVYRLWAPNTAPPAAKSGVLLISDKNVVLGQSNSFEPAGRLRYLLSEPLVIGGIVATAIAVPVALSNRKSSTPSSP